MRGESVYGGLKLSSPRGERTALVGRIVSGLGSGRRASGEVLKLSSSSASAVRRAGPPPSTDEPDGDGAMYELKLELELSVERSKLPRVRGGAIG